LVDSKSILVFIATGSVAAWGVDATLKTPLDALPGLSDTPAIIHGIRRFYCFEASFSEY
jgi:Cu/Ag efflux pump CusA